MSNQERSFRRLQAAELASQFAEPLAAIEVKSGRVRDRQPGLTALAEAFKPARKLLVGGDGIPVEDFLLTPVARLVAR